MKVKITFAFPVDMQANYYQGDIIEAKKIKTLDIYITKDGHVFTTNQVEEI